MAFTPENDLEAALVHAVKDPAAITEFYRLLLVSELLVLGTAEGQEDAQDKFSLAPGGRLSLVSGERDGQKFLPVFSSLARMQDYIKDESKYLRVAGRDLFETTRGAPLILNPASEYGKKLGPDEIAYLLNPSAAGDMPTSEPMVMLGEADFPQPLLDAVLPVFRSRPDVTMACMIRVTFADRAQEPHPLIGVETSGDMASLMLAIQQSAERHAPGMVFDVQRIDRARRNVVTDALLQAEPFYQAGTPAPLLN